VVHFGLPWSKAVPPPRVFLLSPARTDGRRAQLVFNPNAAFDTAVRLRSPEGIELGSVFSFLSGLYFRGKLTYARAFEQELERVDPILVITPERGLVPPETRVTLKDLGQFRRIDIASGDDRYLGPLRRDIDRLEAALPSDAELVLLGSIATGKYVDALLSAFGARLVFPSDFVGRGDMSRGGLLLRSARDLKELSYTPVLGAVRRGKRPPKLEPLSRGRRTK
jgi:hypothetical protein